MPESEYTSSSVYIHSYGYWGNNGFGFGVSLGSSVLPRLKIPSQLFECVLYVSTGFLKNVFSISALFSTVPVWRASLPSIWQLLLTDRKSQFSCLNLNLSRPSTKGPWEYSITELWWYLVSFSYSSFSSLFIVQTQ